MITRALIMVFICIITGCSNKINPAFVAQRWSDTLGAFNIDAVFPPRYIQVGDVFLFLLPNEASYTKNLYSRRSLRLGRADVRQRLMDDMKTNLVLPSTDTKDPKINIFGVPSKIVGLRTTAYPGFDIATVTEGELGASFPVQAFRAVFGGAASHELAMSISIPQAEDSELPAYAAYDALANFCTSDPDEPRCSVDRTSRGTLSAMNIFVSNLCTSSKDIGMYLTPYVLFVNHVYYTRQINYSYSTTGGAALNVSASLLASNIAQENVSSNSSVNGTSGAGGGTIQPDAMKASQTLQSTADGIGSQMGSAGGKIKIAYAGSKGTVLAQTFNSPVAIGYRGIWLKIGKPDVYCGFPVRS